MARPEQLENMRPWGTLQPDGFIRHVIALTHKLPLTSGGRWCAGLVYRLVQWRLGPALDCVVYGSRLRLHPVDNPSEALALFTPQMFAVRQRKFLDSLFDTDFTMIDVGADVGLLSLYAAARAGDDARVIAVESDPELHRRLRYNIGASGIQTLQARHMIIADESGTIMMAGRFGGAAKQDKRTGPGGDNVAVAAETLAGLLDAHDMDRVTVLRMARTGYDYDALAAFFTTAGRDRFPAVLMVTGNADWPETDPAHLAVLHGYRVIDQGEEETILALSDIKTMQISESV